MKPRKTASAVSAAFPKSSGKTPQRYRRALFYYGALQATINCRLPLPNTLELRGDVPTLEPGQSFTLDAVITQAAPKTYVALIQANLCYDPRYFDVVFIPAS